MSTKSKGIIKYFLLFIIFGITFVMIILGIRNKNFFKDLMQPFEIISSNAEVKDLQSTDGRTNILVLGLDRRDSGAASGNLLTDTILVASVDEKLQNPVLISIPRDTWVEREDLKTKINSVYAAYYSKAIREKKEDPNSVAVDIVKEEVEKITGIPIHYNVMVGFDAFQEVVDTIGGIDVNVERTFDDYEYPIEGKENALPESERYMHIHFDAGKNNMNGEKALQFARSRHSTNPEEAGDFARARRQQKVIDALKDKMLSSDVLLDLDSLKGLYESYKANVTTDVGVGEIALFYKMYKNSEIGDIQKIVLSNETYDELKPGSGTLKVPSEEEKERYNNLFVLIPVDSSYNNVHALIRSMLFK